MALSGVRSALWTEMGNGICLQLTPAGQKIVKKTLTDHFLDRFKGKDSWAFQCIITESLLDESLSVDGLGDSNSLWNVDSVEVIVEELGIYSQIRFFNHLIIEINWWISIKPVNHLRQSKNLDRKANNFPIRNCSTILFRANAGVTPILLIYLRHILICTLLLFYCTILYFSRKARQLRGSKVIKDLDRWAVAVKRSYFMSYLRQKYWQARTSASRFDWWRPNRQILNLHKSF